jgi:hypothetical protein
MQGSCENAFSLNPNNKASGSGSFAPGDFFGKGVAMNAQNGGGSKEIAFVPAHDLCYKAFLEPVHGFGIQNSFVDHLPA